MERAIEESGHSLTGHRGPFMTDIVEKLEAPQNIEIITNK